MWFRSLKNYRSGKPHSVKKASRAGVETPGKMSEGRYAQFPPSRFFSAVREAVSLEEAVLEITSRCKLRLGRFIDTDAVTSQQCLISPHRNHLLALVRAWIPELSNWLKRVTLHAAPESRIKSMSNLGRGPQSRAWREIAEELLREHDLKRTIELADELSRALIEMEEQEAHEQSAA